MKAKLRQGKARQGTARQGKARQGKARQGKARQGTGDVGSEPEVFAADRPGDMGSEPCSSGAAGADDDVQGGALGAIGPAFGVSASGFRD